ncbi:hypothetical protein HK101_006013 [Irineochytrium annulatum]|nr:hypothetical protein HK101_006013 [Irineochytrium annulatum]
MASSDKTDVDHAGGMSCMLVARTDRHPIPSLHLPRPASNGPSYSIAAPASLGVPKPSVPNCLSSFCAGGGAYESDSEAEERDPLAYKTVMALEPPSHPSPSPSNDSMLPNDGKAVIASAMTGASKRGRTRQSLRKVAPKAVGKEEDEQGDDYGEAVDGDDDDIDDEDQPYGHRRKRQKSSASAGSTGGSRRSSTASASASSAAAAPLGRGTNPPLTELRKERNRLAAQRSRDKKTKAMTSLQAENDALREEIDVLKAELARWRLGELAAAPDPVAATREKGKGKTASRKNPAAKTVITEGTADLMAGVKGNDHLTAAIEMGSDFGARVELSSPPMNAKEMDVSRSWWDGGLAKLVAAVGIVENGSGQIPESMSLAGPVEAQSG